MNKMIDQTTDILGVGIGPFNLSLAALLSTQHFSAAFFDRQPKFNWHPDLLLPNAEIQVNYLKDLVTLADPTNPYSFIAYLSKHNRLYRFLNANFAQVQRREFNAYLQWVSNQLNNLHWQEPVSEIDYRHFTFQLKTNKRTIKGKHLILGSGLTPTIAPFIKPHLSANVFHSEHFLAHKHDFKHKRIAIIGGGQSAAEIVNHLLHLPELPEEINWISKRNQLLPLDESAFVHELFTPNYTQYFYSLQKEQQQNQLKHQLLASDGISSSLLESIYQRLYTIECVENQAKLCRFLLQHELIALQSEQKHYSLTLSDYLHANTKTISADIIILCTGYHWEFPAYLEPLKNRIALPNGRFDVNADFSINWDGPKQNRIYIQNGARHTHGISDPNLCLMAWRSATIINSIAEQNLYALGHESSAIDWSLTEKPLTMLAQAGNN